MIKRYRRNIDVFTIEDQKKVNNLKVCVIGCGGIGTYIIESLTRFGVETITAVDKDVIDDTDLNRLIHSNSKTIGRPKAKITKKYVQNISNRVNINTLQLDYTEKTGRKIIKNHDVVIDASGDFEIKRLIEEHCLELKIPHVHTFYRNLFGQVAILTGERKYIDSILKQSRISTDYTGKPIFTSAIIGNIAVLEVMKYILGYKQHSNELIHVNLKTLEIEINPID